ncbi:ATP-binding protein, partial [Achromobacter xylosoxidans]
RHIALEGRADGATYVFSVSDNGPGIAADALPRLFTPFYTTRAQGMGLGLALCETLAGAMDGRLAARNLQPAGACFTLALPLAGDAA